MKLKQRLEEKGFAKVLCRNFKEFNEFYESERHRAGDIVWRVDANLRFKIHNAWAAAITRPNATAHEICLTRYPFDSTDAFTVAHEITHIIYYEENAHVVIYERDKGFNDLKNYLGTLLEDYSVDSFLQEKYHFNLEQNYIRRLSSISIESHPCVEAFESQTRLENAIVLANDIIKWRLITNPVAVDKWNIFLNWYRSGCPRVFSMGCEIADMAGKLETIEERLDLFSKIVKNYELYGGPLEYFLNLDNSFCI